MATDLTTRQNSSILAGLYYSKIQTETVKKKTDVICRFFIVHFLLFICMSFRNYYFNEVVIICCGRFFERSRY